MQLQDFGTVRTVGNTLEIDQLYVTVEHNLTVPWYPDDFDHCRASADLESILSGRLVDAYEWSRVDGRTVIANAGYGCIMETQLENAVTRLQVEKDTRQASVVFWDGKGSPSCTLTADFKIRHGVLNAVFFQRSTDVTQLPYDLYNFAGIALEIGKRLSDVKMGTLVLVTTSLHSYL